MFTGLVEETGKIQTIAKKDGGNQITIEADYVMEDLKNGDSIAVNGTCLTVEVVQGKTFTIFAVPETLTRTNIGTLKENQVVNLERAVKAETRLGGHIVQGHVEAMAEVLSVDKHENYWDITIAYDSPYIIPKGSIALDGISLTIHKIENGKIVFQIIPETLKKTNIPQWSNGSFVNIETDYLVKAIDNIARWHKEHP